MEKHYIMSSKDIKYFFIHCSGTRRNDDCTAEQLYKNHKARGIRGIGYHFYIHKDGTMTQHHMLLEASSHNTPFSHCSIAICYEGGLNEHGEAENTLTNNQYERICDLLAELHQLFPKAMVVGHRDLPCCTYPTECPSLNAKEVFGKVF